MKVHPVAELFPMLAQGELQELADDIATNGLRDALTVDASGRLLDGRNRLRACELVGVRPRFETYSGPHPEWLVVSRNIHRRHLDPSQRAAIAEKARRITAPERRNGQRGRTGSGKAAAAKAAKVDPHVISAAAKLPDAVLDEVIAGKTTVTAAAREVTQVERLKPYPRLASAVRAGTYTAQEADQLIRSAEQTWPDDPAERKRRIANAVDHPIPRQELARVRHALDRVSDGLRGVGSADLVKLADGDGDPGLAKRAKRLAERLTGIHDALAREA